MDDKFWRISYSAVRQKIRIFVGHEQNLIIQNYQNLMEMMSRAFGDGDDGGSGIPANTKLVQTEADLMGFMKAFN